MRLRPAPARPWASAGAHKLLSGAERSRLLLELLAAASFDEACAAAGVRRGAALLTRSQDIGFAQRWDDVMALRIAEVEARLADVALVGLRRGLEPGEDARQAIALGQWLVDARRSGAGRAKAAAPRKRESRAQAAGKVENMFQRVREAEEQASRLA